MSDAIAILAGAARGIAMARSPTRPSVRMLACPGVVNDGAADLDDTRHHD